MDSPLAVEATTIFGKMCRTVLMTPRSHLCSRASTRSVFQLRMAITSDESKMINFNDKPKVILSASGMCEAGRIRHHLEAQSGKDSTILFVGYQVPGTLWNMLLNGAKGSEALWRDDRVQAKIENLPGISGPRT